MFDKRRRRELLGPGTAANRLVAYEDKSLNWDAWDIDRYFEEQFWPLSDLPVEISVVETGPYRAALRLVRPYGSSRITQIISLEREAARSSSIPISTGRTGRPCSRPSSPSISTSPDPLRIQFGHVKRATHRNTSWDRARFEASMHRFVDMSEPDFGAALLNDSKYAYDAVEQKVRLSLVRGSGFPDPDADRGEHRIPLCPSGA